MQLKNKLDHASTIIFLFWPVPVQAVLDAIVFPLPFLKKGLLRDFLCF